MEQISRRHIERPFLAGDDAEHFIRSSLAPHSYELLRIAPAIERDAERDIQENNAEKIG
jgi:hypothetical protein